MTKKPHHLMVGSYTYCEYTGCQAGRDVAEKTGVHTCSMPSGRMAARMMQRLREFLPVVRIVPGACPHA